MQLLSKDPHFSGYMGENKRGGRDLGPHSKGLNLSRDRKYQPLGWFSMGKPKEFFMPKGKMLMGQGPAKMPKPGKQPITRGPVNPGPKQISGKQTLPSRGGIGKSKPIQPPKRGMGY